MSPIHETAANIADLCASKNAAYGDSVGKSAEMLKLLYPFGLSTDEYLDALFAARNFDKRCRLAQGAELHGEDPRIDLAGYALLELTLHNQAKKGHHEPCASVSEKDAAVPSMAPNASAAEPAAQPTTGTASVTPAPPSQPPSPLASGTTSASADAPAPTATAPAPANPAPSLSVAELMSQAQDRNCDRRCPYCNSRLDRFGRFGRFGWTGWTDWIHGSSLVFDNFDCVRRFKASVGAA